MYVEIIHHGDIGSRLSGPGRCELLLTLFLGPNKLCDCVKSVNYVRLNHNKYNLLKQSVI